MNNVVQIMSWLNERLGYWAASAVLSPLARLDKIGTRDLSALPPSLKSNIRAIVPRFIFKRMHYQN